MTAFSTLVLLATALAGMQLAGTSAQSISSQCQSALGSIVASSDASCLNTQGLVGLVLSSSGSSSVVPTIDSWLQTLCSRPACSNNTLAAVVQNVTTGCQSDLSNLGLGNITAPELTNLVQSAYPTVREVLCLADTNNGSTLCVTETLNNIEPYTGTLTVQTIESIVNAAVVGGSVPNIPSNVTCTDCIQASYNVVSQRLGSLFPADFNNSVSSTCGSSFTDGTQPSTVTELASNDVQSSTNVTPNGAALGFSAGPLVGLAGASIVALVSAFAFLT